MHTRLITDGPPQQYALVFDNDEEVTDQLRSWAAGEGIDAAMISAVGGFRTATLGYYDVEAKRYVDIPVDEQVEVLTLTGDITRSDEGWTVHAHCVCGRRDGTTIGGHVQHAVVRPTLEVIVTVASASLRRHHDDETGLALIDLR